MLRALICLSVAQHFPFPEIFFSFFSHKTTNKIKKSYQNSHPREKLCLKHKKNQHFLIAKEKNRKFRRSKRYFFIQSREKRAILAKL